MNDIEAILVESTPPRYRDGRTRRISVSWLTAQGPIGIGRIEFNISRSYSRFVYNAEYSGPPLDPVNLPSNGTRRSFEVEPSENHDLLHRVFLDYMPGPWGLNILFTEFPYLRALTAVEKLHWLGNHAVGSLAFHVDDVEGEQQVNGSARLEEVRRRSVDVAMGRLARVGNLDLDAGVGPTPRWILEGLAAFGGARPKCIFRDRRGGQWLAKFNLDGDPYNCARVEHGTALLAKAAGINAVVTRCVRVPGANDILFIKRFDRDVDSTSHKVSIFSLLPSTIAQHHSGGDYRMIFDMLEKVCSQYVVDSHEMVRRMLFNIAVNNTDDHLKNFEVILNAAGDGFSLAPAFDVTIDLYPNERSTHVFGSSRPSLDEELLEIIADELPISLDELRSIRSEVVQALSSWRAIFKMAGVNEKDLKRLSRILDRPLLAD